MSNIAKSYKVETYDGFDVGNEDPTKPLISNESFLQFINSKNGDDLFNAAMKLYNLEINDKAEIAFKECLKQNIKPDTSAFKLGNTLLALGKTNDGIAQLELAAKYNPSYLQVYFNLGVAYYDTRQFQKSIDSYTQTDKLKINDDEIIYGIAASQYGRGQYDESYKNCKKALELNKQNENAKQLLSMLKGKH